MRIFHLFLRSDCLCANWGKASWHSTAVQTSRQQWTEVSQRNVDCSVPSNTHRRCGHMLIAKTFHGVSIPISVDEFNPTTLWHSAIATSSCQLHIHGAFPSSILQLRRQSMLVRIIGHRQRLNHERESNPKFTHNKRKKSRFSRHSFMVVSFERITFPWRELINFALICEYANPNGGKRRSRLNQPSFLFFHFPSSFNYTKGNLFRRHFPNQTFPPINDMSRLAG